MNKKLYAVFVIALALVASTCDASTPLNTTERDHFTKAQPCPAGRDKGSQGHRCGGHVIDHVVPLCAGGKDVAGNMQWLTTKQSKAKAKTDRKLCATK